MDNLARTPFPFKVCAAQNLEGTKKTGKTSKTWAGWIVTMHVHPLNLFGTKTKGRVAGVERFKFKARVLNSHTLVVETPSLDFSDAGNDDDVI